MLATASKHQNRTLSTLELEPNMVAAPRLFRRASWCRSSTHGISRVHNRTLVRQFPQFHLKNSYRISTASSGEQVTDEVLNNMSNEKDNQASCTDLSFYYIAKICGEKDIAAISQLLQSLRDRHGLLSTSAYNLLLGFASKGNHIEIVSQIFKYVLISPESLSSSSYIDLAKAFRDADDGVLLSFLQDVSRLAFPRSTVVVNRIIFAFSECRLTDKALLIFHYMKSLNCKPDLVTYNTVLAVLGRADCIDEMLHEFGSMKEANIVPDIFTYNTMLHSLRNMGKLDLCLTLFRDMGDRGIKADVLTYTALIENFGRAGKVEDSLRLFEDMKQRCIRPSIYVYRSLINNLRKAGKSNLAATILNEMNSNLSDLVGPKDISRKRR